MESREGYLSGPTRAAAGRTISAVRPWLTLILRSLWRGLRVAATGWGERRFTQPCGGGGTFMRRGPLGLITPRSRVRIPPPLLTEAPANAGGGFGFVLTKQIGRRGVSGGAG